MKPKTIDFANTEYSGQYKIRIVVSESYVELWRHVEYDWYMLIQLLYKHEIQSFRVELDI